MKSIKMLLDGRNPGFYLLPTIECIEFGIYFYFLWIRLTIVEWEDMV